MTLKSNWPTKGLFGKIGAFNNEVARLLNGAEGFNGVRVHKTHSGLQIYGGETSSRDLSKFSFGLIGFDGQDAIIRGGPFKAFGQYFRIGGDENRVRVGGNEQNKHLIVVEITRAGGRSILPVTIAEAKFTGDTADIIREPLYRVYLDDGEPVLDEIISIGMRRP